MIATTEPAKRISRRGLPDEEKRTDVQIAASIRRAFEWDEFVPHDGIRSTVRDGRVTIEGRVPTLADGDYVERVVRLLPGVKGVENLLRVARI